MKNLWFVFMIILFAACNHTVIEEKESEVREVISKMTYGQDLQKISTFSNKEYEYLFLRLKNIKSGDRVQFGGNTFIAYLTELGHYNLVKVHYGLDVQIRNDSMEVKLLPRSEEEAKKWGRMKNIQSIPHESMVGVFF